MVLGMDWLELHSLMKIHWVDKWLQFTHHNKVIKMQGILPSANLGAPISQYQLQALDKTDSILYVVQLQAKRTTDLVSTSLPPELQSLLKEFDSVFTPPTELPPER